MRAKTQPLYIRVDEDVHARISIIAMHFKMTKTAVAEYLTQKGLGIAKENKALDDFIAKFADHSPRQLAS